MDVDDMLADFQPYHSRFQIEQFILGAKHSTPWGTYKQTLRELHSRHDSLASAGVARELLVIDIEELSTKKTGGEYDARRDAVRLEAMRKSLAAADRNADDVRREYDVILARATELKAEIGDITDERRDQLEADFWYEKFRRDAMLDVVLTGRIGRSTFELILSLPMEQRRRLVESLQKPPRILAYLLQEVMVPAARGGPGLPGMQEVDSGGDSSVLKPVRSVFEPE